MFNHCGFELIYKLVLLVEVFTEKRIDSSDLLNGFGIPFLRSIDTYVSHVMNRAYDVVWSKSIPQTIYMSYITRVTLRFESNQDLNGISILLLEFTCGGEIFCESF